MPCCRRKYPGSRCWLHCAPMWLHFKTDHARRNWNIQIRTTGEHISKLHPPTWKNISTQHKHSQTWHHQHLRTILPWGASKHRNWLQKKQRETLQICAPAYGQILKTAKQTNHFNSVDMANWMYNSARRLGYLLADATRVCTFIREHWPRHNCLHLQK